MIEKWGVIKISNKHKQILKWIFVAVILGMIIYTFRDSAGPIIKQLKETSPMVVLLICLSSAIYELLEGWVTYGLAKQYNPEFTYAQGVASAFFCSFYRVATLGSGAGLAGVYYFNEKGIPVSRGTGMYMMEYVLHKLSIAIFSGIFFVMNWRYMNSYFGDYSVLLVAGYAITFAISAALVLVCFSRKLHQGIIRFLNWMNRSSRLDDKISELKEQAFIMEEATAFLLRRKLLVFTTIIKDLLKLTFWYGIPFIIFFGDSRITFTQILAITSLSVMMAAVVPSPAGIGSTEFIFALLFSVILGEGVAGSASLLYRFGTFVFPFLVGGIIVFLRRLKKRQKDVATAASV